MFGKALALYNAINLGKKLIIKHLPILFSFLLLGNGLLQSQDCLNPVQVCFNNPATVDDMSTAPAGANVFCFEPDNSIYLTVTTNSTGGDLVLNFNNLTCPDSTLTGDSILTGLDAVLFEVDPNNPCDQASYNTIACSTGNEESFTLEANFLSPQSTYYIMVDAISDPSQVAGNSECTFSLDATGQAVLNTFTAGPDLTIPLDEQINLQSLGTQDSLYWSPTNGFLSSENDPNPLVTPNNTTDYVLSALIDGCWVSDTMTVTVVPSVFPFTAFTPNNDGYNEIWEIANIFRFPRAQIKVFTRWGQVVFRSTGYNTKWDGTFGGSLVPAGTYYYVIQLNDSRLSDEENLLSGTIAVVY